MKLPKNDIYFTKNERIGFYFIIFCIVSIILSIIFANRIYRDTPIEFTDVELIPIREFNQQTQKDSKDQAGVDKTLKSEGKLFTFDPNTAPLDSLKKLPFPNKIAERIDKYRSKGGKFKTKQDFSKIYGIEPYFDDLQPYIDIKSEQKNAVTTKVNSTISKPSTLSERDENVKLESRNKDNFNNESIKEKLDTFVYDPNDYREDEEEIFVELNGANLYELMLINGIGEYYAEKIMAYKVKTGGFTDVNQLKDVIRREELLDKVLPYFTVDESLIRKRSINRIQRDSLSYIPGISYRKAAVVIAYRGNHAPLKGREDLVKMKVLKEDEIEILMKYLNFDY